jgi:signal transduction histidine kinase
VNDVLGFARIEAGALRYRREDVPLRPLLERLEAVVEAEVGRRGQVYTNAVCDASLVVQGDAERIEQVLINLLSNALKYTAAGGTISVRCQADADVVRIHVADTGCGIEADRLEHVFEPFVRVGPRSLVGGDGIGLGLAISRDVARAMDGDVTAVSQPDRGSIFTLTLPRGGTVSAAAAGATPEPADARR